ncbi:unnamed protein product, partial [Scytosiphon promiscuus]
MTDADILSGLTDFVSEKQFLFFALVCSSWRAAWGSRPTLTSRTSPDSTVAQLRNSFDCGLPTNRLAICKALALHGSLETLQYARERGCPWNEFTCCLAAARGHLRILQWLRENGCPWDAG